MSSSRTSIGQDDELVCRKKTLRDAIVCMGWIKLLSVVCYMTLYFLVSAYSDGPVSTALRIMICVTVPFLVAHAMLLFLGGLEDKTLALYVSIWLCLIIAAYNTVLGLIGAVFFIRTGFKPTHFCLAAVFALLALSILTVICHDVIIIYSYKQIVNCENGEDEGNSLKCCKSRC